MNNERLPIFQIPALWLNVLLESSETYIKQTGNKSIAVILIASLGPLLITLIYQFTISPL